MFDGVLPLLLKNSKALMVFYHFGWLSIICDGLFFFFFPFFKYHENYSSRFPKGSKKRKSKHDHGQEKRRPSTLLREKMKIETSQKCNLMFGGSFQLIKSM